MSCPYAGDICTTDRGDYVLSCQRCGFRVVLGRTLTRLRHVIELHQRTVTPPEEDPHD